MKRKAEEHFLEEQFANIYFEMSLVYSIPYYWHQNQRKGPPGKQAIQNSDT